MVAIIAITEKGKRIASLLGSGLPGESRLYFPEKGALKKLIKDIFDKRKFDGIIFIMALGIVVRLIARHLKNKHLDPAVVAVDEAGRSAVSVVSGHEGGANRLALLAGNILCAEPIITTASESRKKIIIGIGSRKGIKKEEIIKGIEYAAGKAGVPLKDVKYIATVDIKKNESGIKEACLDLDIPLRIISSDTIRGFKGSYQRSSFVKSKIGIEGVSEPCALLAGRRTRLIVPKIKLGKVTAAVAREV